MHRKRARIPRFLLGLDSSEAPGASHAAEVHGRRDGVSESSFICAVGEPEAFFGPGTPLHFGKQWVMIIVAYREEIQLYCFNAAACLQEPPSSVRAELDSLCFCVQITHFVCIFSIFLLCYSLSLPCVGGKTSSVSAACSWVSLPSFCHTHWFQINTLGMFRKAGTSRSCSIKGCGWSGGASNRQVTYHRDSSVCNTRWMHSAGRSVLQPDQRKIQHKQLETALRLCVIRLKVAPEYL